MTIDPASYRDPAGRVHLEDGRVYRTVSPVGQAEYRAVRESGALEPLVARGWVIGAREVSDIGLAGAGEDDIVLEHPRIPVISYPYEWSFGALKAAALLHLDIQLALLASGIALSDSSAFNLQFDGGRPVFIDYLSFRRYRSDEPWLAHRQFCEQFLNPLVLRAKLGIPFQPWFRGRIEGIPSEGLAPLLKLRHRLVPSLLSHVVLPARLQRRLDAQAMQRKQLRVPALKASRFRAILLQLRHFIAGLVPAEGKNTTWSGYVDHTTYADEETDAKRSFVARFVSEAKPALLIDLGCNTGEYAQAALEHGAERVVGLENDHGALEAAQERAAGGGLQFLPLFQDLADPTPDQGWDRCERPSLAARLAGAEAVLALALIHHLAIARNVPLPEVVRAVVSMAPAGIIEFVPKRDPTIQSMLDLREDIFADYSRETFVRALEAYAEIVEQVTISTSGRELFHFRRR